MSYLSFDFSPGVQFPIGEVENRFDTGGIGSLKLEYKPPIALPLHVGADIGYMFSPYSFDIEENLNISSIGALAGTEFHLGRIALNLNASGGYYYGFTRDVYGNTHTGGNPYFGAGAHVSIFLSPSFLIGVGSSYRNYFGDTTSVMSGVSVGVSTAYRHYVKGGEGFSLPSPRRPALLKVERISTGGIFPVFYQYYDEHPIGKMRVVNEESKRIKDIAVSVFINSYMDSPKTYEVPGALENGEEKEIELYALFNERVLDITEGTKVAAEITVDYTCGGKKKRAEHVETLRLEHRNASVWDDDRRAAAFVTAKDPVILKFSKNLAGMVRGHTAQALDFNMQLAMAIHRALSMYGVSYVVDPKTPYSEYVRKERAIDFLQFPRQTLEYKAGDCDDLSILYAALLESVSIDTAFITVPGHIYLAFALDVKPNDLRSHFSNPRSCIIHDGRVWIPIEVTKVGERFIDAWEAGADQWGRYSAQNEAELYPLAEAWELFAPVGLPGSSGITYPDMETVHAAYTRDLAAFVDRELGDRVRRFEERITEDRHSSHYRNKLGVLYAQYGLYDLAEEQFETILKREQYLPALINMGNLSYLQDEPSEALGYYSTAHRIAPANSKVLASMLRVYREQNNSEQAEKTYSMLARVDSQMADEYRDLAGGEAAGGRAGTGASRHPLLWEE
jgi:tetratricopeptide (TPR) repeat protein